jgi:hypothetical protein
MDSLEKYFHDNKLGFVEKHPGEHLVIYNVTQMDSIIVRFFKDPANSDSLVKSLDDQGLPYYSYHLPKDIEDLPLRPFDLPSPLLRGKRGQTHVD